MRISANVTEDFGNVTGLRVGAELRGMDCRKQRFEVWLNGSVVELLKLLGRYSTISR